MTDEVIQELWKIKDDIAREYSYNIDDLAAYYRGKQIARLKIIEHEKSKQAEIQERANEVE